MCLYATAKTRRYLEFFKQIFIVLKYKFWPNNLVIRSHCSTNLCYRPDFEQINRSHCFTYLSVSLIHVIKGWDFFKRQFFHFLINPTHLDTLLSRNKFSCNNKEREKEKWNEFDNQTLCHLRHQTVIMCSLVNAWCLCCII